MFKTLLNISWFGAFFYIFVIQDYGTVLETWVHSHTLQLIKLYCQFCKSFLEICIFAHKVLFYRKSKLSVYLFIYHRASSSTCRVAAFAVLKELCYGCCENLALVSEHLITLHHQHHAESAGQWEVINSFYLKASVYSMKRWNKTILRTDVLCFITFLYRHIYLSHQHS